MPDAVSGHLTLNELRSRQGSGNYEDGLPDEIRFLGKIIGDCFTSESMLEINKMIVKVKLESDKLSNPAYFTIENASRVTINLVVGQMCIINNRGVNDLVAYMLQMYFSMLETYEANRILN